MTPCYTGWVTLPNGRTVLLRVSPDRWSSMSPRAGGGGWVYVSGEARSGYTEQFAAGASVVINHNLGRRPASVTVRTLGGVVVDVACVHLNDNQLVLQFDVPSPGVVEIS